MSTKAILITVGVIILIIIAIFLLGKYKGKQWTPEAVKLPTDIQPNYVTGNSEWNPGPITESIYDELNGFSPRDSTPYNNALALSNSQLVAVNNDWNKRKFKDFDNQTIRQALAKEYTIWNYSWVSATSTLVDRLKSLGLD
jgi:hypothetical protein